jgi:hypothetical protein
MFWRSGISAPIDSTDKDVHDTMINTLNNNKTQRIETGVIIGSMASAIMLLYVNGRKDMKATRIVINRLAHALERLPCRPELCNDIVETESDLS